MAYSNSIAFNDLPNLPPAVFVESPEILRYVAKAARHLGELNGLCASLPDPQLLISRPSKIVHFPSVLSLKI